VTATATRGGPKAITDLAAHAGALRAAAQTSSVGPGTPEQTERLNLIDGIILELVREARAAADSAGKALGEPSLVTAFALTELYGTWSRPSAATEKNEKVGEDKDEKVGEVGKVGKADEAGEVGEVGEAGEDEANDEDEATGADEEVDGP
jgi:hypothetical protein